MTHAAIYVRMSTEGGQAMKRDLNLVREILLQLESTTTMDAGGLPKLDLPGRTDAEISYHVKLMHGGGLIDAHDVTSRATPIGEHEWKATGLTSEGHEFLVMAGDESAWRAMLARVGGAAAAVALSIVTEYLREFANRKLGLPR